MPSKLAIDGGSRVVPEGMIKSWPVITDADRKALVSVLDSGHLHGTSAPLATELQNRWAEYCGTKYAIVTSSGTGALHMSMMAAGVMPGDEVIVPAFTYWATVVPVVQQSGIPITRRRSSRRISTACRRTWTRSMRSPASTGCL
jgi:aspartate/methionine/tyrosine aminotransferase